MGQKIITLKNGINLLHIKNKDSDVCALGLSVAAGSYFEESGQEGVSHLLEHMIARSNIGGEDFRKGIYQGGGILEASTSVFKTYYYLKSSDKDFEKLLKMFVEGVFNPNLIEKDFKESKQSLVSELSYLEDVESYKILREMMWKDPKLSKPISGSKSSILSLELTDLKKYFQSHYSADKVSVVLLSPMIPDYLLKILETVPNAPIDNSININLQTNNPAFRVLQERNLKSAITLSFPTRGYENLGEGRHYFNLAANCFAEYYLSKLGSGGLIYEQSWVWNLFPKNGDFVVFLDDVEHSHLVPCLNEIVGLLDKWIKEPMDEKIFETIKKHRILDLKTHTSIDEKIILLTKTFSTSEEVHTYDEAIEVYEKSDLETVVKSIKETLLTQKPFIVVSAGVDSEESVGEVEEILEKYYS